MVSCREKYESRLMFIKIKFFCILFFSINGFTMVVDNLDDTRARWDAISDNVMGGVSEVNFYEMNDGSANFYRLEGLVSTKNNGGFIQSRTNVNFNSNEFTGVRIKIRGNGNEYYVNLRRPRMMPWNYFTAKFYASEDWQVIDLPLSSFTYSRNPNIGLGSARIRSLAIVAYGKDFEAQLDIASVELY